MHMQLLWNITIILACGAVGGLVNAFIGDSQFHLPKTENDIWQPGYIGVVFIGMVAAFISWATLNGALLLSAEATTLHLGDTANALLIGFGGTKWWKSEGEKDVLQKTAGIAAGKTANSNAAAVIASATPLKALEAAVKM